MSAKKFVTLALTHKGKLAILSDVDVPFPEQVARIKKLRGSEVNEEYAEVFKPFLLKGGYRFMTKADAKKRADAIAKQQADFEAAQKAEAEKKAAATKAEQAPPGK